MWYARHFSIKMQIYNTALEKIQRKLDVMVLMGSNLGLFLIIATTDYSNVFLWVVSTAHSSEGRAGGHVRQDLPWLFLHPFGRVGEGLERVLRCMRPEWFAVPWRHQRELVRAGTFGLPVSRFEMAETRCFLLPGTISRKIVLVSVVDRWFKSLNIERFWKRRKRIRFEKVSGFENVSIYSIHSKYISATRQVDRFKQ